MKRGNVSANHSHLVCMPVNVRIDAYWGSCNDTISVELFHEIVIGNSKELGKSRISSRFIELKRFIIMIIRGRNLVLF